MLQLQISTGLLWKESHSKGPLDVIIPNPCQSEITLPGPHNEAGVKIAQRENETSGGYRLKSGPSLGLCFAEHLSLRAAAELKPRSGICWYSAENFVGGRAAEPDPRVSEHRVPIRCWALLKADLWLKDRCESFPQLCDLHTLRSSPVVCGKGNSPVLALLLFSDCKLK